MFKVMTISIMLKIIEIVEGDKASTRKCKTLEEGVIIYSLFFVLLYKLTKYGRENKGTERRENQERKVNRWTKVSLCKIAMI